MVSLEMQNYNATLTERQQKYLLCHQVKSIITNILQAKPYLRLKILSSDQERITEKAKFKYFPLGKAFENQIKIIENQGEKQIKAAEENKKKLLSLIMKRNLQHF